MKLKDSSRTFQANWDAICHWYTCRVLTKLATRCVEKNMEICRKKNTGESLCDIFGIYPSVTKPILLHSHLNGCTVARCWIFRGSLMQNEKAPRARTAGKRGPENGARSATSTDGDHFKWKRAKTTPSPFVQLKYKNKRKLTAGI